MSESSITSFSATINTPPTITSHPSGVGESSATPVRLQAFSETIKVFARPEITLEAGSPEWRELLRKIREWKAVGGTLHAQLGGQLVRTTIGDVALSPHPNPRYAKAIEETGASADEVNQAIRRYQTNYRLSDLTKFQREIVQAGFSDLIREPEPEPEQPLSPSVRELESALAEDPGFKEDAEALAKDLKISLQKAAAFEYEAQYGDLRNIPDNVQEAIARVEEEKEWGGQPRED